MLDKVIKKHKKIALQQAEYQLVKDYIIDKKHLDDPMEIYYGKKDNSDNTNIDSNPAYSTSNN